MKKKIAGLLCMGLLSGMLWGCAKAPSHTTSQTTEPTVPTTLETQAMTEPVTEPTTEPTTEPITEPTTEPTEPPTQPPPADRRAPVTEAPTIETVDASFFDDAVFVGDSISMRLSQYAASSGLLGKAKFLSVASLGVRNALNDHPETRATYKGVRYKNLEDAIAATGAKKVFIMFGMNDLAAWGVDKTVEKWADLLELIRGACGDVTIYIQSMTPVWTGSERGKLTNANVLKYNEKLGAFARDNGCKFIDVHPYMLDSTGGLAKAFCSDKYVHLTTAGAKVWVAVLKAYSYE